jgi:hypothetical protein
MNDEMTISSGDNAVISIGDRIICKLRCNERWNRVRSYYQFAKSATSDEIRKALDFIASRAKANGKSFHLLDSREKNLNSYVGCVRFTVKIKNSKIPANSIAVDIYRGDLNGLFGYRLTYVVKHINNPLEVEHGNKYEVDSYDLIKQVVALLESEVGAIINKDELIGFLSADR